MSFLGTSPEIRARGSTAAIMMQCWGRGIFPEQQGLRTAPMPSLLWTTGVVCRSRRQDALSKSKCGRTTFTNLWASTTYRGRPCAMLSCVVREVCLLTLASVSRLEKCERRTCVDCISCTGDASLNRMVFVRCVSCKRSGCEGVTAEKENAHRGARAERGVLDERKPRAARAERIFPTNGGECAPLLGVSVLKRVCLPCAHNSQRFPCGNTAGASVELLEANTRMNQGARSIRSRTFRGFILANRR